MSEQRLLKEIEEFAKEPPDYISANPINGDIYHWEAIIMGPEDSDYRNGVFLIDIKIPPEYPYKAPLCKFKTKIYHPNINSENGTICLSVFETGNWRPSYTISRILLSIIALLYNPNFESTFHRETKEIYNRSKEEYKNTIQKWIKDYSGKEDIKP